METLLRWGTGLIGVVSCAFGLFTALRPGRSIALYQGIMARFNWRVAPIDEAREVRTTRLFGIWLVLMGALLTADFFYRVFFSKFLL